MQFNKSMIHVPVTRRRSGSAGLSENQKVIYQLIRRAGTTNRADLVRASGLTFPSVSRIVAELLDLKMVQEGDKRRGLMGKPPIDLSINPEHGFSLGVYLEGEMAHSALLDALGTILYEEITPCKPLVELFSAFLANCPVAPDRLIGTAVSTTETTLADSDLVELQEVSGVPVYQDSLIAASVRYECYFGHGKDHERFVLFDAEHLELGAMVGREILAQPGTLAALLAVTELDVHSTTNLLPNALNGALTFIGAKTLIVSGVPLEDFAQVYESFPTFKVIASPPNLTPAAQVATLPFYDKLSV